MVRIRKPVTGVEEIVSDGGRPARRPVRKVAAVVRAHDDEAKKDAGRR